jgi:hypothetical protein
MERPYTKPHHTKRINWDNFTYEELKYFLNKFNHDNQKENNQLGKQPQ